MKEVFEFRVYYEYAHLLFRDDEGKNIGTSVKIVQVEKTDPGFRKIQELRKQLREKNEGGPFGGWQIIRHYTKEELENAQLFHLKIKRAFEPEGERCGTVYDESTACKICKANATQVGPLKLKKGVIPKLDIARTIADEVVISEKFLQMFKRRGLKGGIFKPVILGNGDSTYYQLSASSEIELTSKTIAGGDPFNTVDSSPGGEFNIQGYKIKYEPEVHKCPLGHTIGTNLLSEVHALTAPGLKENDFFASKQKVGVRRGVLRQHPVYLCSPTFRKMVLEEKLKGFDFEVAHIDKMSIDDN